MKINIAIVDDELLFRKSISFLMNSEQRFNVIFDGADGEELLNYLSNRRNIRPDIVLMDIRMPKLNGIQTSKLLSTKFPQIKIIALSTFDSEHFIELMVKHGALAYIPKNSDPEKVIYTIEQVYHRGIHFEPEMMSIIINTKREGDATAHKNSFLMLSDRETEVLQLIFKQLSTKEIADELCISERTVEGHRKKMMQKTKSKNVVGLILWGIKNQVLSLNE